MNSTNSLSYQGIVGVYPDHQRGPPMGNPYITWVLMGYNPLNLPRVTLQGGKSSTQKCRLCGGYDSSHEGIYSIGVIKLN